MNLTNKTQNNYELNSLSLEVKFRQLAEQTAALLGTGGVTVRAFTPGLKYFKALEIQKQASIVDQLEFYHNLCAEQIREHYEIKDNHAFVWRAMRALGLVPTADLLSHITDENIVEIHSKDNVQLFRNFKFFEFCSYSLEEIYSLEWWNLYHRDTESLTELVGAANKIYGGHVLNGMEPQVAAHIATEIRSAEKLRLQVSYDWLAPVFHNKNVSGCVSIARATLISN